MAGPVPDLNPLPPANLTELPEEEERQVIRWERFLPRRSLRVLLVEHDDSTRHIVAALLRKCSYGVSAVADGLKAWEVLKEKQYRFDLVLTEVEIPSLSGIGLLSKIMSCEFSKDIPVIMMSSDDSVSVVYKCMLKGAVDCLVKPVRRNELRNLWQHVWRKHCSASYENGDESINNNAIKSGDLSNNNAASNHAGIDAGFAPKDRERSNDGEDTKSSGSKPELQTQSVERHEKPTLSYCSTPTALNSKVKKQHDDMMVEENVVKDHYSKSEEDEIVETTVETISKGKNQKPESFCATISCNKSHLNHRKDGVGEPSSPAQTSFLVKPSKQMIDFIGAAANGECGYEFLKNDDERLEATEYFHVTNVSTTDALPSWELSLRGPDVNGFSKKDSEERQVLKHSAASAFSRYSAGICFNSQKCDSSPFTLSAKTKTKIDGDNAAKEDKGSSIPTWMVTSSQGNEDVEPLCNRASSSSNNGASHSVAGHSKDSPTMTHSSLEHTNRDGNQNVALPSSQLRFVSHPFPVRGLPFQSLYPGYGGMVPPLFYTDSFGHGLRDTDKGQISSRSGELRHNGNHDMYDRPTMRPQICEGSQSCPADGRKGRNTMEKERGNTLMCSDTAQSSKKQNCGQNHLNGAQCNGSCDVMDATGTISTIPEFPIQNVLQDHERKALSRDCSRREAALLKFRLKRKDRCFEKKVRYHNRQKLAEQRPRIKGQFVRQSVIESNTATIEEGD